MASDNSDNNNNNDSNNNNDNNNNDNSHWHSHQSSSCRFTSHWHRQWYLQSKNIDHTYIYFIINHTIDPLFWAFIYIFFFYPDTITNDIFQRDCISHHCWHIHREADSLSIISYNCLSTLIDHKNEPDSVTINSVLHLNTIHIT